MSTVRLRRLAADHARLQEYVQKHARVRLVQTSGDPPERYQLEYLIRSLRKLDDDVRTIDTHLVEITLPVNYPRTPPQCRMLSPVFHPNIAPHAICVGDHWSAGESLQSIVTRIGEILAYQSYNSKSPLNGEAARWVDGNKHRLPLDTVSMLVEELQQNSPPVQRPAVAQPTSPSRASGVLAPSAQVEPAVFQCPACGMKYRLAEQLRGRRVKCKKCTSEFEVPAA